MFEVFTFIVQVIMSALGIFLVANIAQIQLNIEKSFVAAFLMVLIQVIVFALVPESFLWMLVTFGLSVIPIKVLSGASFWGSILLVFVGYLVGAAVVITLFKALGAVF